MATTPEQGLASMMQNLKEKTGRSIEEWIATARASASVSIRRWWSISRPATVWTHGYANQIAQRALVPDDAPAAGSDKLVDAQYTGAKAAMRPCMNRSLERSHRWAQMWMSRLRKPVSACGAASSLR